MLNAAFQWLASARLTLQEVEVFVQPSEVPLDLSRTTAEGYEIQSTAEN